MTDHSHTHPDQTGMLDPPGHGWYVGTVPDDWTPRYDGYQRGVTVWTPEQWDSWSAMKRQAMFELWDELAYLSHRPYGDNVKKLTYAQAMYRQALS